MSEQNPNPNIIHGGPLNDLPPINRFITGHDQDGKSVILKRDTPPWAHYSSGQTGYKVLYTTDTFPVDFHDDKDVKKHQDLMGTGRLGLVSPGGLVFRVVDFSPGYSGGIHRTQSLD